MGRMGGFNPHSSTDWENIFNRAYARHGASHGSYSYTRGGNAYSGSYSDILHPIKKTDDYGLAKEWGDLSHIPRSQRSAVESKLHKLHKIKHLGATEGERAAGAAALARLKSMHHLRALLDNLIEFGVVSISTAKNVIRDLNIKGGGTPAKLVRPKTGIPNYVYPGMTAAERLEAQSQLKMKNLPLERSVVIPRKFPKELFGGKPDPLSYRLHETGHSADPHLPKWVEWKRKAQPAVMKSIEKGNMEEAEKRGAGIIKSVLQNERRANMGVLTSIQTHGKPEEATAWKKIANAQMRGGYRLPLFTAITKAGAAKTLTEKKQVLKQIPELRGKTLNLSSPCSNSSTNVIQFGVLEMIQEKLEKRKEMKRRHKSHGGGT